MLICNISLINFRWNRQEFLFCQPSSHVADTVALVAPVVMPPCNVCPDVLRRVRGQKHDSAIQIVGLSGTLQGNSIA
jgi:hypothetical protein